LTLNEQARTTGRVRHGLKEPARTSSHQPTRTSGIVPGLVGQFLVLKTFRFKQKNWATPWAMAQVAQGANPPLVIRDIFDQLVRD
jgi:hypothetical protein